MSNNESTTVSLSAGDEYERAAGQALGRYKLLEKIGEGGCGVVYVAEQTEPVRRRVALKVIKLGMDTKAVVARFEAERQALAMMDHPNIAKVLDAGATETGRPYFVMELVRGVPLTQYCDQQKLAIEDRLGLFIRVCQAIQHAHQKGIIHRDIKPSNILVAVTESEPTPKVIDFGIAKATQQQLTDKTIHTHLQQFIGTPAYMSPEQAEMSALDIDTRSDIYSLGVLLYELLTGQTPFETRELLKGGFEMMRRVIRDQEPARPSTRLSKLQQSELTTMAQRRRAEAPRLIHQIRGDLDWIVMKCLEKDRTRRYDTANGLARDIQRFLRSEPVTARPPSAAYRLQKFVRRNRVMVGASALVAATLVLGVVASTWQAVRARHLQVKAEANEQRARAAQVAEANQRLEAEKARLNEARLRKEAQAQAYASDMKAAQVALQQNNLGMAVELLRRHLPKPGEEDLRGLEWRYLWQQCRGDELRSFIHPSMVHTSALAPDGSYLATAGQDGKVRIWETASAKLLREFGAQGYFHDLSKCLAVSPNGKWLAFVAKDGVELRDTRTWKLAQVLKSAMAPIGFDPTSKWLVAGGPNGLEIWDTTDWSARTLTNVRLVFNNLAFTPKGDGLVCGEWLKGQLLWVDLQAATATVFAKAGGFYSIAVSPDGKWLAAGHGNGEVSLWDLATRQVITKFSAHWGLIYGLAFSPDGRWLATGGNDQLIHLWSTGTTNQLATFQGHLNEIYSLSFSMDGRVLVSASKDGTARLWDLRSGRTRSQSLTLPDTLQPLGPLADGTALVTWDQQKTTQLWSLADNHLLQSNSWSQIAEQGCEHLAIFPTSQRVIGIATNGQLHLWNLRTGERLRSVPIAATGFTPRFLSRDERWLLGNSSRGGALLYNLSASRPAQAFPDSYVDWDYADFSPDGRWLAHATTNYCIRLWDLANHQERAILSGHKWNVWAVRFSPDSRILASGAWDGDVWLWSVESGKPICPPLKGHRSGVLPLTFSTDGKTLVTGSDDRTIRWWNVATGREMLLLQNAFLISAWTGSQVEFNPGGKMVLWQEFNGPVRVTGLPSLAEIDAEESRATDPTQLR